MSWFRYWNEVIDFWSNEKMVTITVDVEKCNGCGACVDSCQRRVLEIQDGVCVPVKPDMCRFCMLCVAACKPKAISVEV